MKFSSLARPTQSTHVLFLALSLLCAPLCAKEKTPQSAGYARQYIKAALKCVAHADKNLPAITRLAEIVAKRHLAGGKIGSVFNGQMLAEELTGRSGGMINYGFGRGWDEAQRTPQEDANNVALISWERAPNPGDLAQVKKLKADGTFIIAIGPRALPELAAFVPLADAWLDTGLGADDRLIALPNGTYAVPGNALANMLNGWALIAEVVGALTRRGVMPPLYQSYLTETGRDWGTRYVHKKQFHDDLKIAPQRKGKLGRAFLKQIRENIERFRDTQMDGVEKATKLIIDESRTGRKTLVAMMGHAPSYYVGKYEDAAWTTPIDYAVPGVPAHAKNYDNTPDGALVLRLGYTGMHQEEVAAFTAKHQRVILLTTPNPRPEWQIPEDKVLVHIDMGYAYGDAAVTIPGYPIRVLPPSGIMQLIAYESINSEVLAALSLA
jgi:uncharacterized phosphosugar-binding protein